jgi:hypothetical protein
VDICKSTKTPEPFCKVRKQGVAGVWYKKHSMEGCENDFRCVCLHAPVHSGEMRIYLRFRNEPDENEALKFLVPS